MKLLASIFLLLALTIGILYRAAPEPLPPDPVLPVTLSKGELAKIYLLGREIARTQMAAPETLDELDDAMIRNMLLWGHDYKGCQKESMEATYRCLETITDEEVELVRRAWKREGDFVVEVREP
ncbi:hypothetical protein LCGC14_1111610 [marine sediment metagenome]|uniref:Uncharacterized protein n=1 Tax=marine sediment metagenome TaxID=412755 RepID=A0A0F9QCM7_9ZZZZ